MKAFLFFFILLYRPFIHLIFFTLMTGFFSDFLKRNDAIYVRVCGSTVSNFALLLMAVLCPASHQAENGIRRTNDNGDDYLSNGSQSSSSFSHR
jgi:hypothetical protein